MVAKWSNPYHWKTCTAGKITKKCAWIGAQPVFSKQHTWYTITSVVREKHKKKNTERRTTKLHRWNYFYCCCIIDCTLLPSATAGSLKLSRRVLLKVSDLFVGRYVFNFSWSPTCSPTTSRTHTWREGEGEWLLIVLWAVRLWPLQ